MRNLLSKQPSAKTRRSYPTLPSVRQDQQDLRCAFNEWASQPTAATPSDMPVIIANRSSRLNAHQHGVHDLDPTFFLIATCASRTGANADFCKNMPPPWLPAPAALPEPARCT